MTISYTVSATAPFADLANAASKFAEAATTRSLSAKTIKEARFYEGQASAYHHMIHVLLSTTIRDEDIGEGVSSTFTSSANEALMTKLLAETLELAQEAYSADRYQSWEGVAQALLERSYTPKEAAAIMLSKWTRWAADSYEERRDGSCPADAIIKFIDDPRNNCTKEEVAKLVAGTYY
jgi:hypothetical protein